MKWLRIAIVVSSVLVFGPARSELKESGPWSFERPAALTLPTRKGAIRRIADGMSIELRVETWNSKMEDSVKRMLAVIEREKAFKMRLLGDEPALVEALRNKLVAGTGLDVFEDEPLPLSSPLRSMSNALLPPHNANSSEEHWKRHHDSTIGNLVEELNREEATIV